MGVRAGQLPPSDTAPGIYSPPPPQIRIVYSPSYLWEFNKPSRPRTPPPAEPTCGNCWTPLSKCTCKPSKGPLVVVIALLAGVLWLVGCVIFK